MGIPPKEEALKITAVIRTRDAKSDLSQLVSDLRQQKGVDLSILVVDNCSQDGTIELAHGIADNTVQISDEEWSWGRALNMGVENVRPDDQFVLVVSADVQIPRDSCLAELTACFQDDPSLAAVFPRQIPRPNAPLLEVDRIRAMFTEQEVRFRTMPPREKISLSGSHVSTTISNSCGVYRLQALRQTPFREDIPAEEMPWTIEATTHGWHFFYNGSVSVAHSHKEPSKRYAIRVLDLEKGAREPSRWPPSLAWTFKFVALDFRRRMSAARRLSDVSRKTRVAGLSQIIPLAIWAAIITTGLQCGIKFSFFRKKLW